MNQQIYNERNYSFGQALLNLRSCLGLTQKELGLLLGVARHTIGTWEGGSKYPSAAHLKEVIALAATKKAFEGENAAAEIRALWNSGHQKIALDEKWLASLLVHVQGDSVLQGADQLDSLPNLMQSTTSTQIISGHEDVQNQNRVLNLPVQFTPFVGRSVEKTALFQLLTDPQHRLLTILGPGGVGKTRLALEVAVENELNFADGIAFVPLASLNSQTQIVPALCDALNLSGGDSQSGFSGHLRSFLSGRQMLLILDSFEHLLEGVDLVSDIIAGAPKITVLVTSRERLNLQAEWLFDLEGLSYPTPKELQSLVPDSVALLEQYGAVQLFSQRALQIRPGLAFNSQTLLAIARICQHLSGMPLAIELAAATSRNYNISEIEDQLNQGLALLATNQRDIPARHRSMHAVFEHSWNLLSNSERTLFSRMAVFRGGCTLDAIKKIAGATLPQLAKLVDKSLLRQAETSNFLANSLPQPPLSQSPGSILPALPQRFFLLEPLREFAAEKLAEAGEDQVLRRDHADYFLAQVESTDALWDTPDSNQLISQLDRDYDNVRAALDWVSEGGNLITGLRMGVALRRFWQRRGYYGEGRRWLENLLTLEDPQGGSTNIALRARVLHTAAWLATDQHDYSRATELFEQSRNLRHLNSSFEEETSLLAPEARQARAVGDYTRTVALREETLAYYRASGDRGSFSSGGLGLALYELALALREQGDYSSARILFEECLRLHEELGEREGIGIGLLGLSDLARDLADASAIRQFCGPGLEMCRELGLQWPCGFFLNNLAYAAYLEEDYDQAAKLIKAGTTLFREIQAPASLGEALITAGHIFRARGEISEAYTAFSTALRQVQTTGPRLMQVTVLEGMAGLLAGSGVLGLEAGVQIQAGSAVMRQQMGTTPRPLDHFLQTEELTNARETLGVVNYNEMVETGQKLSLEQIMALIAAAEPTIKNNNMVQLQPPSSDQLPSQLAGKSKRFSRNETQPQGVLLDWSAAPAEVSFYGRNWDLTLLMDWVVEERCRVVSILGLGGVGKSALANRLMRQSAQRFETVIWRSLRDLPSCNELLDDLITTLVRPGTITTRNSFEGKLSLLVELLQEKRVLLVWDNFESVLEEGIGTGEMRQGYEDFGRVLRRLCEISHNSCLIITSREKPVDLVRLEGKYSASAVRTLQIARLDVAACEELLAELGVIGTASDRKQLISNYSGNPLALKIVTQTIHGLFGGDLTLFLKQGETIYGGIRDLLNEHLNRLSELERSVLLWFAIFREPATLDELRAVLVDPWPVATVLETVEALLRRNLLERGQLPGSFFLQPIILEFATRNLVEAAAAEVVSGQLRILIQYAMEQSQASELVRHTQERLLMMPLLTRLQTYFPDTLKLEARLVELRDGLLAQKARVPSYAPANLVGLLRLLRGD